MTTAPSALTFFQEHNGALQLLGCIRPRDIQVVEHVHNVCDAGSAD